MSIERASRSGFELQAKNIGGIDETTVEFRPGVTILEGRNASNRTSLLQALMTALGSTDVSIKADASYGEVTLRIDGETYTRRLSRETSGIHASGEPYLDDPETAELFGFLLESNEARQAVISGGDLRDIIMRPVDTAKINAEIADLQRERERLEEKLAAIEEQKGKLPALEQRRTELQTEIAAKEEAIQQKNAELESADTEITETQAEKSELEQKLETLRSLRSELEDVRYDIETQRERKEALREERREVEEQLDDLDETPAGELEDVETRIEHIAERKATLEADLDEIRSVIEFNEEILKGDAPAFVDEVAEVANGTEDALTTQLLDDEEVTCWTCGSSVDPASIKGTIDRLRELNRSKFGEFKDLKTELSELKRERQRLRQAQRKRNRLERRLAELDTDIETTDETLKRYQKRREDLTREVTEIEETVEALEENVYSDLLDMHREANQLEYELERLEADLQEVNKEIENLEESISREDDLRTQRETVQSDITDLRTKIERIEQAAVDRFNESMETVLRLLDYDNLARIWIEPSEREVHEGRAKTTKRYFELHIVRTSDSGTTYEDTVDHLSESEREVTGLVFALAGYLAHDVAEQVPFLLLDSLEAIDSERIAELLEYLSDHAEHLIVALLPEDADAIDDRHQRITNI